MNCPICGQPCEADFVDIGVGEQRISPYRCQPCQWVESGDNPELLPIDEEDFLP